MSKKWVRIILIAVVVCAVLGGAAGFGLARALSGSESPTVVIKPSFSPSPVASPSPSPSESPSPTDSPSPPTFPSESASPPDVSPTPMPDVPSPTP